MTASIRLCAGLPMVKLNLTESCLDRHLHTARRNKAALIWEGEPGDTASSPTSSCTARSVAPRRRCCGWASTGDRVIVYMPMVPELVIAVLACARIGATHSVIFGGFSAEAIRDRINDAGAIAV
jgi:acetyl-CoA synthetase